MPSVEAANVLELDVPQGPGKPSLGAAQQEVIVRRQDGVRMDLDVATPHRPGDPREEIPDVVAALKERAPRYGPVHDMVPASGAVLTGCPSHSEPMTVLSAGGCANSHTVPGTV